MRTSARRIGISLDTCTWSPPSLPGSSASARATGWSLTARSLLDRPCPTFTSICSAAGLCVGRLDDVESTCPGHNIRLDLIGIRQLIHLVKKADNGEDFAQRFIVKSK